MREFGVALNIRRAKSRSDKGGKSAGEELLPSVWLGATLVSRANKPVFASLTNGGPAEAAGISPGDELIALDGVRVIPGSSESRIRRYKAGDVSTLTVFRGDDLLNFKMTWSEAPSDTCFLTITDEVDERQARRASWLSA